MNMFKIKIAILNLLTLLFIGLGVWFGLKFEVWQSVMMFMLCNATIFDTKFTILQQRIEELENEQHEEVAQSQ